MAWYKTGAVTINNGATSVTGIGTKFVSNSRVGDGFRGPDGEWYELINQGSETTIGIYPPYAGPSVVASTNYMIAPLQGYNKETADRLRFITDNIRDFTEDVDAAAASAAAAKESEDAAKQSEINAKASEDDVQANADAAAVSEQAAAASEAAASQSQQAASISETNAKKSETNSSISEVNAKTSETNAAASAEAARLSAEAAALSEINAKGSEDNAKVSETNSKGSETSAADDAATATAEAVAAATAKTQAEVAQAAAEKAARDAQAAAGSVTGQLMDQGPWDASTGVYPARPVVSSFWKVTGNGSATDKGVTIEYGIGDTLMYSLTPLDEFYKIDNTESVSSVAGKTGVVDLDKDDVGLDQVDNTSDANKPISNATQAALDIRVPTTSRQDTTAGHLVKVGDYGDNGGSAITVANTTDANTITVSGLYAFTGGTNIPDQNVYLRHMKYEVAGNCKQLAWGLLNDKEWVRTQVNSVWSTWVPVSDIVDALTSTDPKKVLSANQGNVLYNMIQANNATIVQYAYNIPTATTVISGVDTSGKTLSYVPGAALIVVLNGFNLRQGIDFTATTGTSISLTKATEAASEINITVFGSFSVADMYTKIESDALLAQKVSKTDIIDVAHGGTGNNGTLTALASDVNWDTLISPGSFFIPTASGSSRPVTTATTVNYIVEVINTPNGLKQTATLYGTPQMFSRSVSSGSWQSWYKTYDNNSIVGTVSQSGGVPTGAIIEKGSNSQGSYVRYADGTQICWIRITTTAINQPNGSMFNTLAVGPGVYPATFVAEPVVTASGTPANHNLVVWASCYTQPGLAGWGGWCGVAPTSSGGYAFINLTAIGRWY